MARFLLRRVAAGIVTLFVSSVLVFALVRLIPGNPIASLLLLDFDPVVEQSLRRLYELDKPIVQAYIDWITGLARGEFGVSILSRQPVAEMLAPRIPPTLYLMTGGIVSALVFALPVGIVSAMKRDTIVDRLGSGTSAVLMSTPEFFLGFMLIVVFSVYFAWLPVGGYVAPSEDFLGFLRTSLLPWITIGAIIGAIVGRVLRSSLLDVLSQQYIRTARSRGDSEARVMFVHSLRNAAIPTVTVLSLQIGYLMGGAIVVEEVFAYPGMGRLIVSAIEQRDYPLIQASLLFFAASFVVLNLLTDIAYGFIDPRIDVASSR